LVLRSASDLEDLDLSNTKAGSATTAAIAALPRLYRVNLDSTAVTDSDMAALASSPIEDLSLRGVVLHRLGIEALSRCETLKSLAIQLGADWNGLVNYAAKVDLTAMPPSEIRLPKGLRRLRLQGELTSRLVDGLGKLENLERIDIAGGGHLLSDIGVSAFAGLRVIMAESSGLDDYALDRLSLLPGLQELFISDNGISKAVARLQAPYLNTLELRNTLVDDSAVEAFASLPGLHCLDIPHTHVTPSGVPHLVATARNLQSLALDATQITTATVEALAGAAALVELYLYGEAVTDETVATLRALSAMRELNVIGARLTESVVPHLVALAGLRTLRVYGSRFSASARLALLAARPDVRIYADTGNEPTPVHLTRGPERKIATLHQNRS
jgi:Leucine-rich repeat (LRR) protein